MASIPPVIETITPGSRTAFPTAVTRTGTVSTSGTVVTGVGTSFTSFRMGNGDTQQAEFFLYDDSSGELRSIKSINSNTQMILNAEFSTPLSGASFITVSNSLGNYNTVEVYDTSGAVTVFLVDGVGFTVTATENSPLVLDSKGRGIPAFSVSDECQIVIYH